MKDHWILRKVMFTWQKRPSESFRCTFIFNYEFVRRCSIFSIRKQRSRKPIQNIRIYLLWDMIAGELKKKKKKVWFCKITCIRLLLIVITTVNHRKPMQSLSRKGREKLRHRYISCLWRDGGTDEVERNLICSFRSRWKEFVTFIFFEVHRFVLLMLLKSQHPEICQWIRSTNDCQVLNNIESIS